MVQQFRSKCCYDKVLPLSPEEAAKEFENRGEKVPPGVHFYCIKCKKLVTEIILKR